MRDIPIDHPIEEKIAWADACCRRFGDQLRCNERVDILLVQLGSAIAASRAKMAETGITERCKGCEEREGGSCCGKGLENRYSGTLLLVNRLLGVALPERPYQSSSCFFLTQGGCLLKARHVICVNYLCSRVSETVAPDRIASLRQLEGVELHLLFDLNERIKKLLGSIPIQGSIHQTPPEISLGADG